MASPTAFGDPANPAFFMDELSGDFVRTYDGWSYGLGGSQSQKVIKGQCKDQDGNPLGGCVVHAFRTSDDWEAGQGVSDDHGYYEVMVPWTPGDQHYLVAYYPGGSPKAGTTVNTIVPTWGDGT
jgi:hypothetical protein